MVGPRFQRTPAELAEVAQVEALLLVVEHVHALVREELFRDFLVPDLGFDQVVAALHREADGVGAGFVSTGADFVAGDLVAGAAGDIGRLEVAARLVVVGLGEGAVIAQAEAFGGGSGVEAGAEGVAVTAVETADFTLQQTALPGGSELGRAGFGNDGAADAVAADADRRDASPDLELADIGRIDIAQRRVHVVGAGGDEVHAVDLDAQAVVGQTVDDRQAAGAASALQGHTGHVAKQAGGVAGGRAQLLQAVVADAGGDWRFALGFDDDLVKHRRRPALRDGCTRQGTGKNNGYGRAERTDSIPHAALPRDFCLSTGAYFRRAG